MYDYFGYFFKYFHIIFICFIFNRCMYLYYIKQSRADLLLSDNLFSFCITSFFLFLLTVFTYYITTIIRTNFHKNQLTSSFLLMSKSSFIYIIYKSLFFNLVFIILSSFDISFMYILSIFIPFLFTDIFIFSVNPSTGSVAEGKRKRIEMSDSEEEDKGKRKKPDPGHNSNDNDEVLKEDKEDKDKDKEEDARPYYTYEEYIDLTIERDEARAGYEAFRSLFRTYNREDDRQMMEECREEVVSLNEILAGIRADQMAEHESLKSKEDKK